MNDVTRILSAIERGDPQAAEQLLPLVYDELRRLAARKLAQEKPGQTLQATALVHEAYLRLVDTEDGPALGQPRPLLRRRRRGHAAHPRRAGPPQGAPEARRRPAAHADRARRPRRRRVRRRSSWPCTRPWSSSRVHDPLKAKLVELRFFGGLTLAQAAECLGISPSTADRAWRYARAWLYAAMAEP